MPQRKAKQKRKPKNYAKLSQKQKFIEAAKESEADESGETFMKALETAASPRRVSSPPSRNDHDRTTEDHSS